MMWRLLTAMLGWCVLVSPAAACPGETMCTVPMGSYRLMLPENAVEAPMIVHLHGWAAGPSAAMATNALLETATARGFAVIAPQGVSRPGRTQADWAVRDGRPHPRDDVAFLTSVLDDASARFGLDRTRVLLSGFSRGGSFVWDAACQAPGLAAAYAPVAGGFWDPLPGTCEGPVLLHHTHGFADTVVPLEGRMLRDPVAQGDIFAGLQIWRETLGCARRADSRAIGDTRWEKAWTACTGGQVTLALHAGGHSVPAWWAATVLDWFERVVPPSKS